MIVGERLRAVREAKNLSQGDIEKKTGLLRCYLSRCECGHTIPSVSTLEEWSNALGVTMSQLFADDGKAAKPISALKNGNAVKLNRMATSSLRRIERAFAKMDNRDIAVVTGLVQKFVSR